MQSEPLIVQNLSVRGNSIHRGLSYFYNPMKVESSLHTKKLAFGEITLENTNETLQISSPTLQLVGNTLSVTGDPALSQRISLGKYSIETNPKNVLTIGSSLAINPKGHVGINTTSPTANMEVSGLFKSTGISSLTMSALHSTIANLTVTDSFSMGQNLELSKEKVVIFRPSNLSPPTVKERSIGSKLVLFPALSDKMVDYALGVQQGGLWMSLPMEKPNFSFKLYGGEKEVFSVDGTGNTSVKGSFNLLDSGRIEKTGYILHWFRIRDLVQVEVSFKEGVEERVIELPVRGHSYAFLNNNIVQLSKEEVSLGEGITHFSYQYFV